MAQLAIDTAASRKFIERSPSDSRFTSDIDNTDGTLTAGVFVDYVKEIGGVR